MYYIFNNILKYKLYLDYLASGSSNGMIALWNFETAKCDNILV